MRWLTVVLIVLLSAPVLRAQDDPKPDQLKKMYEETLAQLRDAQNRKSELARENARQAEEIAELKKKVEALSLTNTRLARESADYAKNTFLLRSHMAAWEVFIEKYPVLAGRWKVFQESDLPSSVGAALGIQ